MADGQRQFLHGVIEFYQTRTSTHLTVAAEKLASTSVQQNDDMRRITAWVAIIAVPTAVTGFFGQNVPYPGFGETAGFIASAVIMASSRSFCSSSSRPRNGSDCTVRTRRASFRKLRPRHRDQDTVRTPGSQFAAPQR